MPKREAEFSEREIAYRGNGGNGAMHRFHAFSPHIFLSRPRTRALAIHSGLSLCVLCASAVNPLDQANESLPYGSRLNGRPPPPEGLLRKRCHEETVPGTVSPGHDARPQTLVNAARPSPPRESEPPRSQGDRRRTARSVVPPALSTRNARAYVDARPYRGAIVFFSTRGVPSCARRDAEKDALRPSWLRQGPLRRRRIIPGARFVRTS